MAKINKVYNKKERFLLCWMNSITNISVGIDCNDITKPSLIYLLARLQNENNLSFIKPAREWINEIKSNISFLEFNLKKTEEEIIKINKIEV